MFESPIRLVEFTRSFYIGGTEVQVVELLRALPGQYEVRVGVLEAEGPLIGSVRELGHSPEVFPLKGSLAQANTAFQIARMVRWLKRERIALVHVHDFYSTMLVVPAARLAGAKVIVGRLDLSHWQGKARRAVHAQLSRMADHVIANAGAIKRMVVAEEGVPEARVSVIHNGLDLARFEARAAEGLKAPLPDTRGAPVVTHVANMNHPVKRQEDLITALAELRKRGVVLHAYLVGDGERREELERMVVSVGLLDAVHFLSYRSDVPAVLAASTLGVLCSNAEGMSNAVMEGMAAALPMVVTRVGGNPDLIEDGVRGRVVEPEQPEQLARALEEMVKDPERAKAMGEAARSFVERELSLTKMVQRHDALYRQVLRGEPLRKTG